MKRIHLPLPINLRKFINRLFVMLVLVAGVRPTLLYAQAATAANEPGLLSQPGIIITVILILIPLLAALLYMVVKANNLYYYLKSKKETDEANRFTAYLKTLDSTQIQQLQQQKDTLDFTLKPGVLADAPPVQDERGLWSNINEHANIRFIEAKRKFLKRLNINPSLARLNIWFLVIESSETPRRIPNWV